MPIFQPSAPPSGSQRLLSKAAVVLGAAGCIGLGLWEAHHCAQVAFRSMVGSSYIAALLVAIAISLGGILLCIYWRTRALGLCLIVFGLLSYGVFLGGMAALKEMDKVAWQHETPAESVGPDEKASVVIYFRKGTTDEQIEAFHSTVLEQPGQPMHPEPEYPWFVINYLRLPPAQANGFDGVAVSFRHNVTRADTDPYLAKIRADERVEKVLLDVSPGAIAADLSPK